MGKVFHKEMDKIERGKVMGLKIGVLGFGLFYLYLQSFIFFSFDEITMNIPAI